MKPLLAALHLPGAFGGSLRECIGAEELHFEHRRFPDTEHYVRVVTPVLDRAVVVAADLARPDDKLLEVLLFAATLRDLGAASVGLVAPYLPYMRQDARFHAGEGVTSRYFAAILGKPFDWLVTVDPHLHRYQSLWDVYGIPNAVVHAAAPIARWIADHVADPVLVGPDAESRQWVEATARLADLPYVIFKKTRAGDRDVEIEAANVQAWRARTPVLVDDIISSGATLQTTIGVLRDQGLKAPVCVAVHGLFAGDAYAALLAAGAARVVTCNTITHESNAVDVVPLLAAAVTARCM